MTKICRQQQKHHVLHEKEACTYVLNMVRVFCRQSLNILNIKLQAFYLKLDLHHFSVSLRFSISLKMNLFIFLCFYFARSRISRWFLCEAFAVCCKEL